MVEPKLYFLALQLCTTTFGCARQLKGNFFFLLCVHTVFDYFTYSYFIFILISLLLVHTSIVCAFTLLLLIFFPFLYSVHSAINYLCIHTAIVLLFLYFFFSYILFFYLCVYIVIIIDILFYCDVYIILLR